MLTLSNVSCVIGNRTLFSAVDLRLTSQSRVALVGGNGIGKTTLLRIIVGEREPDGGTVARPKDLRLGWLPQDVVDDVAGAETVLTYVLSGAQHLRALEDDLRRMERELEDVAGDDQTRLLTRYAESQDRFQQLGGYELEARAHRVLAGLGFESTDAQRPPSELSGGWRVRAALGRLLLAQPDLLVLDEPTNHLDLATIAWLESTLRELPGGLMFVSHDRDFIDATADTIVELAAGTATTYEVRHGTIAAEQGGFAAFVDQREQRLAQLRAARAQQDRKVAEIERFVERFRYKASKARQVQSRVKTLDRLERIEVEDHRHLAARFQFPEPARAGRVVADCSQVTVRYGDHVVLDRIDLTIERGRKVALVGPNGAGKTTLLRLLANQQQPDAGTVTLGNNVDVAVVDQHQAEVMDLERTVLDEFCASLADHLRSANPRSMLGAFGFPGDLAERRVGELSGGERTRLGLAKAMASPVNLLLLDEPTNHLDLASRDVLEDAIGAYPGTVVLITHDRHVIRSSADAIVALSAGNARWFDGTYEEFIDAEATNSRSVSTPPGAQRTSNAASGHNSTDDREQRRERRRLQQQLAKVEAELAFVEATVADITRQLADPALYVDTDKVARLVSQHNDAKDQASDLFEQWERVGNALERLADLD